MLPRHMKNQLYLKVMYSSPSFETYL